MLVRLRCRRCLILGGGDYSKDEGGVDHRRIPHGGRMVTRTLRRALCAESRVAERGQIVDEFGAAMLSFEFPDATHHNALEVCDDGRSRGVCVFEPGQRTA